MLTMIIGLLLFLGTHSVRVFAEDWRNRQISQRGENTWMGLYAVISLIGFALIMWGYGQARLEPQIIWQPPLWTKHLTALSNSGHWRTYLPTACWQILFYLAHFCCGPFWAIARHGSVTRRQALAINLPVSAVT